MPAAVTGASERVPTGLIVFHDGALRDQVNMQATTLGPEYLAWVKARLRDFGHPVSPRGRPMVDGWGPTGSLTGPGGCQA